MLDKPPSMSSSNDRRDRDDVPSWAVTSTMTGAIAHLRDLAGNGLLPKTFEAAGADERRQLSGAGLAIAMPIVFNHLTRAHEQRRGHRTCALGIGWLTDACLDRFHDDLEAVVEDLLTHSKVAIRNVEGWMTLRLRNVTIDANRRRRGARGAPQRPRLPIWLAKGLNNDAWLGKLAIEIMTWVGVPTTAGTSLWPLDSWAERRGLMTGDWVGSEARTVEREIELVLSVMQSRPHWYEGNIERPLGAKTPPLAPAMVGHDSMPVEPLPLALVEAYEVEQALEANLASLALLAIQTRVANGEDARSAVLSAVTTTFGRLDLSDGAEQRLRALVDDPAELDRIVGVILGILGIR